jgi:hypothetical protein
MLPAHEAKMRRIKRAMIRDQRQSVAPSAVKLYGEITAFARQATRDRFTLDAFYHATQISFTAEGSKIEKVGSVLTVDDAFTDLFLARGFSEHELHRPLIYVGVYWQSLVGRDRSIHGGDPMEIRRTYIAVGKRGLKAIEREREGAWAPTALREEDREFLQKMHAASTLPFTIVETYPSYLDFTEAVWQETGAYPDLAGVDYTTRQGRILFNGGLAQFTRTIEKARAGVALSSASELHIGRKLLEHQYGHFQVLFQLVAGQPLRLKRIDDLFNLLPSPGQQRNS